MDFGEEFEDREGGGGEVEGVGCEGEGFVGGVLGEEGAGLVEEV